MVDNNECHERRTMLKYLAGSSVGIAGLAGCAGSGGGSGGGGETGSSGQSSNGGQNRQITALGGITGGSGYQQCLAFQQILHKAIPNVRVTVSGTSGWKTDAKLMWQQGANAGQFGIVPAGDAYNILYGNTPYKEHNNYIVQAYPAVPPTYLHTIVKKNSGIKGYSDLSGKKINILSRGSLSNSLQPQVMEALGIEPQKFFHYPHQQASSALQRGDIDAVVGAGVASAYMELSQTTPLRVLAVNDSQKQKIRDSIPWLGFSTVDFGQWYQGAKQTTVPAPWTVMGTLLSMDKDFVYKTTKAVFNHLEMASQIYEPASQLTPEAAPKTRVPVHPGSYKFFKEKGVSFPKELQPPKKGDLPLQD